MSDFKVIDSQEEFDLRIKDRLQRKEEQVRNELDEIINNLKADTFLSRSFFLKLS